MTPETAQALGQSAPEEPKRPRLRLSLINLERIALPLIWVLEIIIFTLLKPGLFLTTANFASIFGSQAVVAMLAKIGVKVNLRAQTRNLYFAKILRKNDLAPGETSFYMLGWSPAQTYDVHNVFEALIQTPNKATKKGQFNAGGYSNPKLDALADKMEQETDKAKRDAEIAEATKLYVDDYAYIPLHQQALVWAARKNIDLVQRADNSFPLWYVNVK